MLTLLDRVRDHLFERGKGNSIRLTEALRVMRDAAVVHEEELRLAADVPRD